MPSWGPYLDDLTTNDTVDELAVYIVEASSRTKRDGAPYGIYLLRDRSGDLNAVCWDQAPADDEAGSVALVSGRVGLFREQRQLTIDQVKVVPHPDGALLARIQTPPDMGRRDGLLADLRRCQVQLNPLFWAIFSEALGHDPFDVGGPFWTYAAGQRMHHTGAGDLAWHVLTMLAHAEAVAPAYPKLDLDLLRLAVLTHDLGKLDTYEMGLAGARYLSSERTVGHTYYSMARVSAAIARLREAGQTVDPADEENLLHCLASHHGRREWDALVEPNTPEACALSALDLLDSRLRSTDDRSSTLPERRLAARSRSEGERRRQERPASDGNQASLFEE